MEDASFYGQDCPNFLSVSVHGGWYIGKEGHQSEIITCDLPPFPKDVFESRLAFDVF